MRLTSAMTSGRLLAFARQTGTILVTLLGLLVLTFAIGRLMPVDPVRAIVGEEADPATYAQVYEELGMDKPIYAQFANYLGDIFTLSTSLAGLPGMSIPCGFGQGEKNGKRPVGLQLTGNYFSEARLLNIAHRYQGATDWHLRQPTEQ